MLKVMLFQIGVSQISVTRMGLDQRIKIEISAGYTDEEMVWEKIKPSLTSPAGISFQHYPKQLVPALCWEVI